MKKYFRYLLITLLLVLVITQFIRPDKNSGGYESAMAFENETKVSHQLASILKENCYDCHSNQTQYPWYAEIAPVSYWLADHVKEGKGEFNVSAWEGYSVKKKDHKLKEITEMLEEEEMPLPSYTWIHGKLVDADKTLILQWVQMARLPYVDQLKELSK